MAPTLALENVPLKVPETSSPATKPEYETLEVSKEAVLFPSYVLLLAVIPLTVIPLALALIFAVVVDWSVIE